MSFRLFVYYCALIGGWSGLIGWALGRIPFVPAAASEEVKNLANDLKLGGIRGLFLGMAIALGVSLVDTLWNQSWRNTGLIFMRVLVAFLVGAVGGMLGGMLGALAYFYVENNSIRIVGWTLTGLLVGMSVGVFEVLTSLVQARNQRGSWLKLFKCLGGGAVGGFLGGILAVIMDSLGPWLLGKHPNLLWSPKAVGFVTIGMSVGLFVGLAQVFLKEAWLKVEAGFRPGREMILTKERTTLGRAEACDLGLFGDNTVEKLHASIVRVAAGFMLEDHGSPAGTFVNEQRVNGQMVLRTGDVIRMGRNVLRFRERQKRVESGK
jgi:hypothetical protein